ncbi:hypothetical protein ACFQ67_14915 [Streptomyces sp. NPDC056488]|uniref:hypothetical protein n=1 Tax=Streptomyces sp. NPDC056488 TaxID=3345836 RepID=UPI0036986552
MDIKTTGKTGQDETAETAGKTETAEAAGKTERVDGAGETTTDAGPLAGDPAEEPAGELDDLDNDLDEETPAVTDTGVGAGAAAVVSAALAAVALTGTWAGKVVSERETLLGQIKTSGSGTPTQQISEIYGDAWHSTALVNGVFALIALIVAVTVLALPRRPAWVRAVAVAGAVLGGLGLLLSVGTYFDLFLSLPTAGS